MPSIQRGGEKARAYLPGAKGKTGNPTASKVEAIDALERLGYVKTMRRVQEAYEAIGGDLPEKMRQDLQRRFRSTAQRESATLTSV